MKPTPVPDVVAAVAEHHRLHVDGGAELVGNLVLPPVVDGAIVVPRPEHGVAGERQLLASVLREVASGAAADEALELIHQAGEILGREVRVGVRARRFSLIASDDVLELGLLEAEHDRAEHLDEAPVAIPREARVAACAREPAHRSGR